MGRPREHGYAALWVIGAIAVSAAVGVAVYLAIKEQRAAAAEVADEPPPADAAVSAAERTGTPLPVDDPPAEVAVRSPPVAPPTSPDASPGDPDAAAKDPDEGMFGAPAIQGGLEREAVETVVRGLAPRLERCLAQRVAQGARIEGVMRVTLSINRRGGVDQATSTGLDGGLPPCVLGAMKTVRFGRTRDGAPARVVYPLAFHGEVGESGGQCDEVDCVLNSYATPCCAKFKRAPLRTADPSVNDAPSREEIVTAFRAIAPQIQACAEVAGFLGNVRVRAKFAPSGRLETATVNGVPADLATCAERAARTLSLGASRDGATVTFPYVVR